MQPVLPEKVTVRSSPENSPISFANCLLQISTHGRGGRVGRDRGVGRDLGVALGVGVGLTLGGGVVVAVGVGVVLGVGVGEVIHLG